MKKKRNLYIIAFLCFITLVGVTIAYLQSTSTFENIFEAGTYKTITHEEFTFPTNWTPGDETPKTITTKNEGTIPVRVRVKLEESWTSKNDDDLPLTYNNESVAIINFDNELDWIYKDGYYYYTKELGPNEITTSLIESVTFNPNYEGDVNCTILNGTVTCESTGDGYDGATYKLKITTETIQAKNYETIWEGVPIMYDYIGDNPCTYSGDLEIGSEYVNGQYTYKYRQEKYFSNGNWANTLDDGWGVALTDLDSTEPVTSPLCSSINNKPIVSMESTFYQSKATTIDLSSFDTSNVTNMYGMFRASKAISLDLSSFDTSKVTSMWYMFGSTTPTSIDLSGFDTSNVTNMTLMFENSKFQSIDLSNFNTSNVTNMYGMFQLASATSIDISSFDTSNVTKMNYMFSNTKLSTLNLSHFNTSNVTNMSGMFMGITMNYLDLNSFDTSNVTNMRDMFANSNISNLNISSFDTSSVENMRGLFANFTTNTLNINNFNTSNVTNMYRMFHSSKISVLDLSSFDTTKVTDMTEMFKNSTATTGYARTQVDADRFNSTSSKPSRLTFVVKNS